MEVTAELDRLVNDLAKKVQAEREYARSTGRGEGLAEAATLICPYCNLREYPVAEQSDRVGVYIVHKQGDINFNCPAAPVWLKYYQTYRQLPKKP